MNKNTAECIVTSGINLIFSKTLSCQSINVVRGERGNRWYDIQWVFFSIKSEYFIKYKTGKKSISQLPEARYKLVFILCNIPKDRTLHHLYLNNLKKNVNIYNKMLPLFIKYNNCDHCKNYSIPISELPFTRLLDFMQGSFLGVFLLQIWESHIAKNLFIKKIHIFKIINSKIRKK